MGTRYFLLAGCMMLAMNGAMAQAWDEGGNTITNPVKYVGCDANSTVPLKVMHNANQPIEWYTNATKRMILNQVLTGQTVNGYTGLDLTGFLGIGNFTGVYPRAAARVHSEDNSSIAVGYRPMMHDGFLATQGESVFYGGVFDGTNGNSGLIWSWATTPAVTGRVRRPAQRVAWSWAGSNLLQVWTRDSWV